MSKLRNDYVSILHKAVDIARFAPSSHNCQPWKVNLVSSNEQGIDFDVLFDESRMLNSLPSLNREMYLGCGIFTEFLIKALECQGFITKVSWLDDSSRLVRVKATAIAETDVEALNELASLIKARRTQRSPYQSPQIPDDLTCKVKSECNQFNGKVSIHSGSGKMKVIAELVKYYAGLDFSNRDVWRETFRYICFDEKEDREDGFYFSNLFGQTSNLFRWAFRLGLHPINHRFYSLLKLPSVMANNFAKLISDEGHLMTLTVGDESPESLFSAGQMLGRFTLIVQQMEWVMHPMSVLVQHDIPRAQLSDVLGLQQPLVYVARLGLCRDIASEAPRRSIDSILMSN